MYFAGRDQKLAAVQAVLAAAYIGAAGGDPLQFAARLCARRLMEGDPGPSIFHMVDMVVAEVALEARVSGHAPLSLPRHRRGPLCPLIDSRLPHAPLQPDKARQRLWRLYKAAVVEPFGNQPASGPTHMPLATPSPNLRVPGLRGAAQESDIGAEYLRFQQAGVSPRHRSPLGSEAAALESQFGRDLSPESLGCPPSPPSFAAGGPQRQQQEQQGVDEAISFLDSPVLAGGRPPAPASAPGGLQQLWWEAGGVISILDSPLPPGSLPLAPASAPGGLQQQPTRVPSPALGLQQSGGWGPVQRQSGRGRGQQGQRPLVAPASVQRQQQ